MNNFKNICIKIRDIIWPLLDPLEERPPKQINEKDCMWNDEEIDMILEYIEKYYENEKKRSNQIESKSIIFISIFTVVNTLLISLIKDMISNDEVAYTTFRLILISIIMMCIVYLCRSIWFSIKVLEKRNYHTMGFPKFMLSNSSDKKKQIIIHQYNNINKNQDTINIKVDYMTMAQEYFKRAVVTVMLFSGLSFLNYVITYSNILKNIFKEINSISINTIILTLLVVFIFILYILVIKIYMKLKE